MPHEFIRPNWHVILIHYPLGLLVVGILIELFAFLWRRSGFRACRLFCLGAARRVDLPKRPDPAEEQRRVNLGETVSLGAVQVVAVVSYCDDQSCICE